MCEKKKKKERTSLRDREGSIALAQFSVPLEGVAALEAPVQQGGGRKEREGRKGGREGGSENEA